MLKQGVHPKVVSERLGHANISITLDTYSHVMPGLQQAAAAKFEEAVFGDLLVDKSRKPVDKSSM
jgi:integrase